jgi:integrase
MLTANVADLAQVRSHAHAGSTIMPRPPRPWYDATHDRWRVYYKKKRYTLASGVGPKAERAAWEAFTRIVSGSIATGATESTPRPEPVAIDPRTVPKVSELVNRFLEVGTQGLTEVTISFYAHNLKGIKERFGDMPSTSLKTYHVTEWLASHDNWSQTTRHNVVTAIKRCWKWSLQDGRIPVDNMAQLKRPPVATRITIPNPDDIRALLEHALTTDLGEVLTFTHATGCRIGEAMELSASCLNEDGSVAVVRNKTARKTGKSRVIYVPVSIRDMVLAAADKHRVGPIFRTYAGRPWTTAAISRRVISIREKLGLGPEAVPKVMRHDWITEALARGVPVKIVAELAGHTSTKMIDNNYSHLGDRVDVLARAAESVRSDAKDKTDE